MERRHSRGRKMAPWVLGVATSEFCASKCFEVFSHIIVETRYRPTKLRIPSGYRRRKTPSKLYWSLKMIWEAFTNCRHRSVIGLNKINLESSCCRGTSRVQRFDAGTNQAFHRPMMNTTINKIIDMGLLRNGGPANVLVKRGGFVAPRPRRIVALC